MSILKKIFKASNLITLATFGAGKLIGTVLKTFQPKTPKLASNTGVEQVQDLRAQNNLAKPGEPQTVLYGRNENYYPTLSAAQWFEYIGNEQVLYLRLRITVGICSLDNLRVGKTPISAFAGSQYQLCLPGERMTLFHPNVYTAEQLNGVEMVSGAFQSRSYTGEITFLGNRLIVPQDAASVAARAAAGVNPFAGVRSGNDVVVSGSLVNSGTYEVTGFDSSAPQDWIDTDTTFTPETVVATIQFGAYDVQEASIPAAVDANLVFSSTLSSIKAVPTDEYPATLSLFRPGDTVTPTLVGGPNEYDPFTVLAIDPVDGSLIVTPAPADWSDRGNLLLLRRYFGPYPVCPPGDTVDRVAVDMFWPQGIGSKGGKNPLTMRFDLQYQQIDDAGTPITGWISLDEISITAASRRPVRRSYQRTLTTPARVQLRMAQNTTDSDADDIIDSVTWVGARGYVVARPGEDPDIDTDSTTINIALRNSNNALIQGDETKINVTCTRWLESYNEVTQTWQPERPTRSVILAALDKMRGRYTARGRQVADDQIDLCGAINIGQTLDARGDFFDGQFSVAANLRDNVNTILRLGRTELRYELRNYKFGFYRDADSAPVQMFCDDLNAKVEPGAIRMRTSNDATGVQVSYFEPGLQDEGIIGIGDTDAKPLKVDLRNGCTSRDQAWREANYEWNSERYRNQPVSLGAELEPLVLDRGSRILIGSRRLGWGQPARVEAVGGITAREVTVWPALDWTGTGFGVTFRSPTGGPGAFITCTRIADDVLLLDADLDVEITGDDSGEQRTFCIFEKDGDRPRKAIVESVSWRSGDGPGQNATIEGMLDDARVHAEPGAAPVDPFAPVLVAPRLDVAPLLLSLSAGRVSATWTAPPGAVLYTLEWRYAGAPSWTLVRRGITNSGAFDVEFTADVEARAQAFGSGGETGPYALATLFVDEGTGGPTALVVSVTPTTLYKATTGSAATTTSAAGSILGGVLPYTRAWVRVSGDLRIVADSPTALSTTFTATGITTGETLTAVYQLQVTDGAATVDASPNVAITIQNTASGGTPGGPPPAAETVNFITEDGDRFISETPDNFIAE